MSFQWPEMLWLHLVLPLLVAAYFYALQRKKKLALRYASLTLVKDAMGAGQKWRRHVPPLLFLARARRHDQRHRAAARRW